MKALTIAAVILPAVILIATIITLYIKIEETKKQAQRHEELVNAIINRK